MIYSISIAGIKLALHSDVPFKVNKKLRHFFYEDGRKADINIHMVRIPFIEEPKNPLVLDEKLYWDKGDGKQKEEISIFVFDTETNRFTYQLQINAGWNKGIIFCNEEKADMLAPFYGSLGEILFRNHLLYHKGIVIHGAAIDWGKRGILFSAPSGTGKTTQANLWRKYKKAQIINADRPAVRIMDKEIVVCGTLWNGSSKKYSNLLSSLSGIVVLEQARENTIKRLEKKEAVTKLMPRCFLPYCHEEIMNLAIDNLEKIIATVPVYFLECRPDSEAVELVYQCLK